MLIKFYEFLEKIKNSPVWRRPFLLWPIIATLVLNIGDWLLIYFKFYPLVKNLPENQSSIPLHYNIYLGIDLFGPWTLILLVPLLGLLIAIVNSLLAVLLYNKKEIISYFLIFSTIIIQILFIISTFLTILINI
ncbi:MAG: hypothetical protein WCT18_01270 [Patescibacteria group bacterium]